MAWRVMMTKIEQEMVQILIEEVRGLNLNEPEGLINSLIEAERETTNMSDRRPTLKCLTNLIDNALNAEKGD